MSLSWTKGFSSSDNGSILSGADLANLQSDIDSQVPTKQGTEAISGDWTFSGDVKFNGTDNIYDATDMICHNDDVVSNLDEVVYK